MKERGKKGNLNDIEEQRLFKGMKAFAYTANVPVTLYDREMHVLWDCRPELKICTMFMNYNIQNQECNANLRRAVATAENINEPYVFMCASKLIQIAYAVKRGNCLIGTVIAGPIIMGKNRETALKYIFKNLPDFRSHVNEFFDIIEINPIRTALEVSCIYEVFCDFICFHKLIENCQASDEVTMNHLLHSLQGRDLKSAVAAMDTIFEHAYLTGGGILNQIKVYLVDEFDSLLKHFVPIYISAERYEGLLSELQGAATTEAAHNVCKKIIIFITARDHRMPEYRGASHVIKEAIGCLERHYYEDLALQRVAEEVHVNPSYLSSLFKKETSMTFSQYLKLIRLNQSAKLLKMTDLSLEEIAKRCGFASQSYFIRAFKQYYGQTPGKYRRFFKGKA